MEWQSVKWSPVLGLIDITSDTVEEEEERKDRERNLASRLNGTVRVTTIEPRKGLGNGQLPGRQQGNVHATDKRATHKQSTAYPHPRVSPQ